LYFLRQEASEGEGAMITKKVGYFVIRNDQLDLINDGLMDRGLTAEDVISINYDSELKLHMVWFKINAIEGIKI
jgi:hypothetical protein